MNTDKEILDYESDSATKQEIPTLNQFIVLSIMTWGLYNAWWMYKSWKTLKERFVLDIMPVMRTIFAIFFIYNLFDRIQNYARNNGYRETFSSAGLGLGFILLNLTGRLPEPFWLIALLAFVCLIPPYKALNYALLNMEYSDFKEQESFNTRQIVLIILGAAFWGLVLIGLLIGNQE